LQAVNCLPANGKSRKCFDEGFLFLKIALRSFQAADYFRLGEADLYQEMGRHRQERALVMELLHRYSGLKQRMIVERFEGLDEKVDEPRS